MRNVDGLLKTLLLVAYSFGWSAAAKMLSLYADAIGRNTEVPPLVITALVQIFLCATCLLIYGWFGIDKSSAPDRPTRYKYERRQTLVLTFTILLSLVTWGAFFS